MRFAHLVHIFCKLVYDGKHSRDKCVLRARCDAESMEQHQWIMCLDFAFRIL